MVRGKMTRASEYCVPMGRALTFLLVYAEHAFRANTSHVVSVNIVRVRAAHYSPEAFATTAAL